MIAVLSPAKSLNFEDQAPFSRASEPRMLAQSEIIAKKMKTLSRKRLSELMSISTQLAELNYNRYQTWSVNPEKTASKQAIFAFNGEVYTGLDAASIPEEKLDYTQNHVRILSGLYGLLRPLDAILPYRLEMGTKIAIRRKKNLYDFWGNSITELLLSDFAEPPVIINLASNEYFKSIDKKKFTGRIIDVEFKDKKNGNYKVISFFAKKARGLMARFMIDYALTKPEDLKGFDGEGYLFNSELSSENTWVFTRNNEQ